MDKIRDAILKFIKINSFFESISGYIDSRIKLFTIEITEEIVSVLSKFLLYTIMLLLFFLFLFFLSIGLVHYFNTFFESLFNGYWIVAGIYLSLLILVWTMRKKIGKYFIEIKEKEKE